MNIHLSYYSNHTKELKQRIADSGNLYLIRGKLSTAATIDRAIGDDGKSIPEFKGKTVNKLPSKSCADLDVAFASGHKNRVMSVTTLTVLMMTNVLS